MYLPFALVTQGLFEQARKGLTDNTFAGIHQLSWFDWAILLPYFGILCILSLYGLHRYEVIHTYFKHRKKSVDQPATRFAQLPKVTIQLPMYNERYVVERLIDETTKMDYPKELLQIQVLDDSTDDTHEYAEGLVERYQALGFPIEYKHRTNRKGFKAGALQEGLETATGEFVAIFDSDHIATRAYLQMSTGWLVADPNCAMVQTPHHFYSPDPFQRNLAAGTRVPSEGNMFYGLVQDGNDYWNATFFCGSCAVIRRSALDEIGGIAVETVTEDAHTMLKLHRRGWDSAYLRLPVAAGLAT